MTRTPSNFNTTSTTTTIAVAADYADAMMTARKARSVMFLLLLLVLLTQITLFFLLKFNVLRLGDVVTVDLDRQAIEASATQAAEQDDAAASTTAPAGETDANSSDGTPSDGTLVRRKTTTPAEEIVRYVIPVTTFLGVTLAVVMAVVLLLIVTIMLVGRLIGVSHVTSAFIWCVLLAVMLFPWQAFLISGGRAGPGTIGASAYATDTGIPPQPTFKIPGALYSWEELSHDIRHFPGRFDQRVLKWSRYAVFPGVALVLLLMVQAKSSRGLKYALGESDVQVEVSTPGA